MQPIDQIQLGSALLSITEPVLGHELECNHWHERDHVYTGFMTGASFFSGRRWIATHRLKDLRYPQQTSVADSIAKGSFLAIYWILAQKEHFAIKWAVDEFKKLKRKQGEQLPQENISTAFYRYCWAVSRDSNGVPAELVLEHPYRGLAVMMIDRNASVSHEQFEQFCKQQFLPSQMAHSPIAVSLCLRPRVLQENLPEFLSDISTETASTRYLLLSFLEEEPQLCWPDKFANVGLDMHGSGYGDVVYAAPFIPTIPGTTRYLDQL